MTKKDLLIWPKMNHFFSSMLRRKHAHSDRLTELWVHIDQKIRHNDPKLDKYPMWMDMSGDGE